MSSYSKNLLLLNSIIAMCRSDSKWPHYFYDLGYSVKWVDYPFTCSTGEKVVPDLIIQSNMQNNCILIESKSGNNIENEQAEKYKKVHPSDVVQKLFIDVIQGEDPTVDVMYLCFSESTSSIIAQLGSLSALFPVVELAPNILRLVINNFSISKLNVDLVKGITIDRDKIPMGYFLFDEDSSDSEIAPSVTQTIVAFARQNKPHFKSSEISQDIIGTLWEHFGSEKRGN